MPLLAYLNEKIKEGEKAPRIPIRFGCGQTNICSFTSGNRTSILPMHRHEYFEIFLTLTDKVSHQIGNKVIPLAKNTLCLVRPDDAHTQLYQEVDGEERHLVNVMFSEKVFDQVFTFLENTGIRREDFLSPDEPPMRVLSEMQGRELLLEFEKRLQLYAGEKKILCRNIYGFLAYFFVFFFPSPDDREGDEVLHPPYWLEVTCEKMKRLENFYEGLPRMLEISGKTQEHLARSMKKYYGMTTSQFINDLRLAYVVGRLANAETENESMLDVILDSGFQSPGHFYKLFSEKYGMTPKEYRKTKIFPQDS